MIPLDLTGKVALVTGVGDDMGFAWYIAKRFKRPAPASSSRSIRA